jgi:hypothetical protein
MSAGARKRKAEDPAPPNAASPTSTSQEDIENLRQEMRSMLEKSIELYLLSIREEISLISTDLKQVKVGRKIHFPKLGSICGCL